ncbi:MAG: hypothetical protein A2Y90_02245 [Chloroflexi bacterium RBG_13_52_12]|nr:MAG: hypothetical protein A2Y90_02245 [Chloroflexi bacterium RBG_13_52_12]
MTESKKKILEMLAKNRISADDAYRLLSAVDAEQGTGGNEARGNERRDNPGYENTATKGSEVKTKPKYLRVTVTPDPEKQGGDKVNVRVPMSLIRAGLKMTALIPPEALDKANSALKDKGINFDVRSITPEDLEELIEALGDMEVDVEGGKGEKVKVFVE